MCSFRSLAAAQRLTPVSRLNLFYRHIRAKAVPAEETVLALLKELGHDPQRVAVEKNGTIIPRAQFAEEKLTDADHLEVVCFVGGG